MKGRRIMKELPIRFVTFPFSMEVIPLQMYTVGSNQQNTMIRPKGFSATQVFITLSGSGKIRINGKQDMIVKKHQAFIIFEGVPHEYFPLTEEPWILGFLSIRGASVSTLLSNFKFKNGDALHIHQVEKLWTVAEEIWQLAEINKPEELWEISELLYSFLLELRKQTTISENDCLNSSESKPSEVILEYVTTFLKEHYTQRILLSELTKTTGYSHQHLNRLFHQFYGLTLNQYLQNLRIAHAIDLIERDKQIPLSEIAENIGVETRYFTRLFKKVMGISPGEFKKIVHNQ